MATVVAVTTFFTLAVVVAVAVVVTMDCYFTLAIVAVVVTVVAVIAVVAMNKWKNPRTFQTLIQHCSPLRIE